MEMEDPQQPALEYRIHAISIPEYSHTEAGGDTNDPGNIRIGFGWDITIDETDRYCTIEGRVQASTTADLPREIFRMTARYIFEVSASKPLVRRNDVLHLPTEFVIELLGITYSTMRGILLERLATTAHRGIILPPADPAMLFMHGRELLQSQPQAPEPPERNNRRTQHPQ